MQLDEILGLPARAIEGVVNPFRRAVFDVGDDEAGVEPERGGFDAGDGAPLAAPGFGLVARFGVAAHDGLVRQSALGVVDMDRQEATLVVMGVEERELLMPVNDAGVIDIENTDAGSRS